MKKYLQKFSLQDWIFSIFSIFWMGLVMLDYLNKQVIYVPSIIHFKYFGLFAFLTGISVLLSCSYLSLGPFKKFRPVPINGLVIFGLIVLIVWAITFAYNQYWQAPLDFTNYLHLAGKAVYTLGCSYLVLLAAYTSGNLIRKRIHKKEPPLYVSIFLDICLGFVLYTMILFTLGIFQLLNQFVILGALALLILSNYMKAFQFVKLTLWAPIQKPKDLNFWGCMLCFFILVYVTMNYLYTQAPYPLGFDARNYYVNIAKLIGDSGALLEGFQPYAWSLVMSTGYTTFKSPEIALFFSAFGGILSLFAIYFLGKRQVGLSSNYAFLVAMLYLLTPTVTNHFIIEFKIDLSLVFFQIVTLMFFLWRFGLISTSNQSSVGLMGLKSDYGFLCILGILLGYSLSIKVLSIFLVFGIFVGIWSFDRDIWGVIGLCLLSIGGILISGLDQLSGLRDYHLSPTTTGITASVLGLAFLGYAFMQNRIHFINKAKVLLICGIVTIMTFAPWMVKNYVQSKNKTMITLFLGEKPRPAMNINLLERNYQKYLEEKE